MRMTQATFDDVEVTLHWSDGQTLRLPHLWLRDNCPCGDCRVEQTSEKKFLISSVSAALRPESVEVVGSTLNIDWPGGHVSEFQSHALTPGKTNPPHSDTEYWDRRFRPPRIGYEQFISDHGAAASAIRTFLRTGALVVTRMPPESGSVERLQPRLGPIREVPFGRLHEVKVDPEGYNVAHTALPLPPHNDFASLSWPPSIQALHMLVNECEGGESVIVDGWAVAEALRREHAGLFDVLCEVPVPFRMFSDREETQAANPLIRLDAAGNIAQLRYSNQLMQAVSPHAEKLHTFYQAYHELSSRLNADEAKAVFRLESGECLLVAGHRVLHARQAFEPTGRRHLQDAYFEHDCCRNHLIVIERILGEPGL